MSKKKCAAARSTRLASPLQQPRKQPRFSALRALTLKRSKGEIQAATDHPEIISRPVDDAETQVIGPADVPCESDLQPGTKLSEHFSFATEVFGLRIDKEGVRRSLRVKSVPFAPAENCADTRPRIRRKTRTRNWIPQRKRAENSADGVIVIDSSVNKYRDRLVLEDIETRLVSVQCKSFHTDTSIATEEIF